MIHVHSLDGCAPTPLAHYLKALGVLRLVSEQADPEARGWWEGNRFRLGTKLDRDELEKFFLYKYKPTPMFNPWGARSGYFNGGSEKSAGTSLQQIENSEDPRLEPFREAINTVRTVIDEITPSTKPEKKNQDKLILALRSKCRGSSSLWLDTVTTVIGSSDNISLAQPPIFGTGGNEGSGGYPSAYMSALVEAMISKKWDHAIRNALFGKSASKCHWKQSMLQFSPGGISTPWDMLLSFEGACVLRSSVGTRTSSNSSKWMSSPFYVEPRSAGYASSSRLDEKIVNKGKERPGRGEQWLPIWTRPSKFPEVKQIFLKGRATSGASRASNGWTMARAVTDFGFSLGISEFIRYGYQQRNNQAAHFAVPLGSFRVPTAGQVEPSKSCLDNLDDWLRCLHRVAHPADDREAKRTPPRLTSSYRRLSNELFSLTDHQPTNHQWQDVLLSMTNLESVMRHGSGFTAGPIPRLCPDWVTASDDGTPEFRLALAFALQGKAGVKDSIRRHWLPLEKDKHYIFATSGMGKLDVSPEVVMQGRSGIDDAVALVERRLVEASQNGMRHLPLDAAYGAAADIADLTALLTNHVDWDHTLTLARALMALNRGAWVKQPIPITRPSSDDWPDDAWLAIRLCALPWKLKTRGGLELDVEVDPAIFRRLAVGDAASAVTIALRRLRTAGVQCTVRAGTVSPHTARLWAAALAFPITKLTANRFLNRLDPSKE